MAGAGPDPDAGGPSRWAVADIRARIADSFGVAREAVPDGVAPEDVLAYFQDGARIGRKGMLPGVRARKGTRPRVARDHRYGYVYLFSAACPGTGDAVGQVRGRASTGGTDRRLQETGEWVPTDVSLLRLPPCSPEPNPAGTLFPLLKRRHLPNRMSGSAGHAREAVDEVWDGSIRRKGEVMRNATREWAVP